MPEKGEFEEGEISNRIKKEIEKKMDAMGGVRERRKLLESIDRKPPSEGNVLAKQKIILEKLDEINDTLKNLEEKVEDIEEKLEIRDSQKI
ncbi:MAG: hypothetical protein ACLFUR_02330 [Candidatus Hadarchaeia archaeon]